MSFFLLHLPYPSSLSPCILPFTLNSFLFPLASWHVFFQIFFVTLVLSLSSFAPFNPVSCFFSLPSFHLSSSLSFSPSLFIVTCLCKTAVAEINYHCVRLAIFGLTTRLMPVERVWCRTLIYWPMFWRLWRSCCSVNKKSSTEIICGCLSC